MHLSSNSLSLILSVYWEEIFVRSVSHSILIDEANWSTMDSLMNHLLPAQFGNLPTFYRVGDSYIPDLTFRNLSGFEEKLDPNLKLFFKFFVRLSIFSLFSTLFPQPFFIFGVYNWPLLYSFGLFFASTFPLSGLRVEPLAREMMMLESGRRR